MTQTRLGSLIEVCISIFIGFWIALASQIVIFPMVGIHGVSLATNIEITIYFTLVSVARGYLIRRYFNNRLHALSLKIAEKVQ